MEPSLPHIILALCAGVALSAATGFRAFLPVFGLGLAARMGWVAVGEAEHWLKTDLALITLGTATLVEILADKIPAVDHALDTLATVIRPAAAWAVSFGLLSPYGEGWAAGLASVLAGGAFGVHALKAKARLGSSLTTAGLANPILSLAEDGIAVALTAASILAPLVGFLFVVVLVWVGVGIVRRLSSTLRRAGKTRSGT